MIGERRARACDKVRVIWGTKLRNIVAYNKFIFDDGTIDANDVGCGKTQPKYSAMIEQFMFFEIWIGLESLRKRIGEFMKQKKNIEFQMYGILFLIPKLCTHLYNTFCNESHKIHKRFGKMIDWKRWYQRRNILDIIWEYTCASFLSFCNEVWRVTVTVVHELLLAW